MYGEPCPAAHFEVTRPEWSSFDAGHCSVTNPYPPLYGEVGLEDTQAPSLPINGSESFPPEASNQYTMKPYSPGNTEPHVEETQSERPFSAEGDQSATQPSTQSSPEFVGASFDNRPLETPSLNDGNKSAIQLFFENGRPESAEKGWPYTKIDHDSRPLLVVYYPEEFEDDLDDDDEYSLDWEELHRSPTWSRIAGASILISPKTKHVNINPYNHFSRRHQRWINVPEEGHPNPAKVLVVAWSPK